MTTLPGIGDLTPDDRLGDWQYTPAVDVPLLGGPARFSVIGLEPGQEEAVTEVIRAFAALDPQAVRDEAAERVFENYTDFVEEFDDEEMDDYDLPRISSPADVWDEVTWTRTPVVERHEDGDWFVGCENECEWEREHGLWLTFRHGRELTRVGTPDQGLAD